LEEIFGREVAGFGVPFHFYDEKIADCVRKCGFEYGRMSEETRNYLPWQDPFFWCCGIFHLAPELDEYVEGFFRTNEELALCQIVGHSYDLDAQHMWDRMEVILSRMAADPAVCSMTHLELVRYLQGMKQAVVEDDRIVNPSHTTLWFRIDDQVLALDPGQQWERK
jgi:hypothetical protein